MRSTGADVGVDGELLTGDAGVYTPAGFAAIRSAALRDAGGVGVSHCKRRRPSKLTIALWRLPAAGRAIIEYDGRYPQHGILPRPVISMPMAPSITA